VNRFTCITDIHIIGQTDQLEVSNALDCFRLRLGLRPGQSRKKHTSQWGDNGDDNQQFNESERTETSTGAALIFILKYFLTNNLRLRLKVNDCKGI
jgi:hypothetical protein